MSKSVFFLSHKSIFTYCVYPCSNYSSSQCSFDRRSRHKKYNYIYCQEHTVTGISYSKDMSWRAWSDHSWARDNLLASRQRNKASGIRHIFINIMVSVSKWSGHNEYSNNAIFNNCFYWKHGHVVAAVLSRDQLWKRY